MLVMKYIKSNVVIILSKSNGSYVDKNLCWRVLLVHYSMCGICEVNLINFVFCCVIIVTIRNGTAGQIFRQFPLLIS